MWQNACLAQLPEGLGIGTERCIGRLEGTGPTAAARRGPHLSPLPLWAAVNYTGANYPGNVTSHALGTDPS